MRALAIPFRVIFAVGGFALLCSCASDGAPQQGLSHGTHSSGETAPGETTPGKSTPDASAIEHVETRVRVNRLGSNTPVVGVSVRVSWEHPYEYDRANSTTDGDGVATFSLPRHATLWEIAVEPSEETTAVVVKPDRALWESEPVEIPVYVGRGGSLRGVALDDDGNPVPGAKIECWLFGRLEGNPHLETRSNPLGEFELDRLNEQFVIAGRSGSLVCRQGLTGRVAEGRSIEGLTLHLTASRVVAGRLVDPSGQPIVGAVAKIKGQFWDFLETPFILADD